MFLVRVAFWLSIVIALIPVNPEDLDDGQRAVSTGETLRAAQTVVADFAGFCTARAFFPTGRKGSVRGTIHIRDSGCAAVRFSFDRIDQDRVKVGTGHLPINRPI